MEASLYKEKLKMLKDSELEKNLKEVDKEIPYIMKQVHLQIRNSLLNKKDHIDLSQIKTLHNTYWFSKRVKYINLCDKWKKLVTKIIEKEMLQLRYIKENDHVYIIP